MDNILDLLYEYTKRGQDIDKIFVDTVIKLLSSEKDLKSYIKSYMFQNTAENNAVMLYNWYDKEIILFKDNINNHKEYIDQLINKNISKFERELTINVSILRILLHEIEHANQHRKINTLDDNIEIKLLTISLFNINQLYNEIIKTKNRQLLMKTISILKKINLNNLSKILNKKLFLNFDDNILSNIKIDSIIKKHYADKSIIERLADIYSSKEVLEIINPIEKENPNTKNLILKFLIYFQINGYDFNEHISSPTLRFLSDYFNLGIIGIDDYYNEDLINSLVLATYESLEERLLTGLFITADEYNEKLTYFKTL